jgi:hypothetical protein
MVVYLIYHFDGMLYGFSVLEHNDHFSVEVRLDIECDRHRGKEMSRWEQLKETDGQFQL